MRLNPEILSAAFDKVCIEPDTGEDEIIRESFMSDIIIGRVYQITEAMLKGDLSGAQTCIASMAAFLFDIGREYDRLEGQQPAIAPMSPNGSVGKLVAFKRHWPKLAIAAFSALVTFFSAWHMGGVRWAIRAAMVAGTGASLGMALVTAKRHPLEILGVVVGASLSVMCPGWYGIGALLALIIVSASVYRLARSQADKLAPAAQREGAK